MQERQLRDPALLEQRIGYVFKNKSLLKRALTHRSFGAEHNERLEFLGDSVLNCAVGHSLFLRDKHFNEGVLSRVRANFVCEKTLDEIARAIEISSYIRLGEGELHTGGATRPSIMADACEAVFGAIFLDSDFEQAERVILRLYEPILSAGAITSERLSKDAKTRLQEALQARHMDLPEYTIVDSEGAAHALTFRCACRIGRFSICEYGSGTSRRAAEQQAAAKALVALETALRSHK
ncbi:MAG: ribonuclease III [Sutterella sp.]|nr:ribonuclease III [Sutterella sp.]